MAPTKPEDYKFCIRNADGSTSILPTEIGEFDSECVPTTECDRPYSIPGTAVSGTFTVEVKGPEVVECIALESVLILKDDWGNTRIVPRYESKEDYEKIHGRC